MAEPVSVLNKIVDVTVSDFEFTPDGEKTPIKYKRLVVAVEFDGVAEDVIFEPTQGKLALRLLSMADDQEA